MGKHAPLRVEPHQCTHCGYLLDGIGAAATCPECGSGAGSRLNERRALRKIACIGLVSIIPVTVVCIVLVGLVLFGGADVLQFVPLRVVLLALLCLPGGVPLVAAWRVTRGLRPSRYKSDIILRGVLGAFVVNVCILAAGGVAIAGLVAVV